jgi:hypothetical protein
LNGSRPAPDEALLHRVCSEFVEMPGLRLTCRQAQRLWALDHGTCLELLESLVDAKFLCRSGHGMYARLTDGAAEVQPRMVSARIVEDTSRTKEAV